MTPDEATDALSALVVACNDWTDDKFDLWRRMIVERCNDPATVRATCEQWVMNAQDTFVPPFGKWFEGYQAIRQRTIEAQARRALPAANPNRPSVRAAIDAAKAVIGNGRHREHTPGHIGCQRCDDIAKAFIAEMPTNLGPGRLYRCPQCHDTGFVELVATGTGVVDFCNHASHAIHDRYRREPAA